MSTNLEPNLWQLVVALETVKTSHQLVDKATFVQFGQVVSFKSYPKERSNGYQPLAKRRQNGSGIWQRYSVYWPEWQLVRELTTVLAMDLLISPLTSSFSVVPAVALPKAWSGFFWYWLLNFWRSTLHDWLNFGNIYLSEFYIFFRNIIDTNLYP